MNPANISTAAPVTVIYALTLRKPTCTVSHSHSHIYVMQFSCYFPRKKHFVKKIPIKGKKKDKGQFMSGVIKGSYLSPSASQSVLECFLHINYRKQGEDVAFLHGFSSWKVSQLPAVPPGAG